MADVITNMKVRFSADTKQFKKGMNDGKTAVKSFQKDAGYAMERFANQFGVSLGPLQGLIRKTSIATKGLSAEMKGAATSSNVFTGALKILKAALISTGIGALVVALGSLITYFTKTQRGADKVKTVMAGFKAIINVLIDRLSAFGEGIFKIFTGRFKEGWDALKTSVKGVGEEMINEAAAASQLEKARQRLRDQEISLIEVQAKRQKEIDAARLLSEKEGISAEKKMEALKRAADLERQTLAENQAMQKERIRIMEEEIALGESTAEEYRQLAEEKAKLYEIESASLRLQKRLQTEINRVTNEIEAETAAILKQREELTKDFKPLESQSLDLTAEATLNTDALETGKITAWANDLAAGLEPAKAIIVDFADTFNSTFEGLATGFGDAMGQLLAGTGGLDDFGKTVLSKLGDLMVQVGHLIVKAGLAFFAIGEAFQAAITNPATALVAVAAGVALIAAGNALKSGLAAAASGGGGTFSNNSGVYDNTTGGQNYTPGNYTPRAQTVDVRLNGEARIGNDALYVGFKKAEVTRNITG